MTQPLVLVSETLDDIPARWLAERARVVRCAYNDPAFGGWLAQADGLVVRTYTIVNDAFLEGARGVKVIGRGGVGLDNIDVPACRRRGMEVVYTPDANTQAVVEYFFALILDQVRPRSRMTQTWTAEEFHRCRKQDVGRQLDQLTLGILGFGRIGKRIGRVAAALGMRVLVHDLLAPGQLRQAVAQSSGGLYPYEFVTPQELYQQSDILTIHVDGRPDNRHLISAANLSQLKSDCLLVNAARGFLVDNAALKNWAVAHPRATALLDVHEPEPPREDYELWGLPNVRLYPHLASRTHLATENMSWVVRDVIAVLEGKKAMYPAPE